MELRKDKRVYKNTFKKCSEHILESTLPATHLRSTGHVHARYRQRGYVHSDTAIQIQGADEKEKPPACYRPEIIHFKTVYINKMCRSHSD